MGEDRLEGLLKRARTRHIPKEQLAGYTDEVRLKLRAASAPVIHVRPRLSWWAQWAGVPVLAALAFVMFRVAQPVVNPVRVADASLAEEVAVLSVLEPEDGVLLEDDAALIDELVWLEEELSS